jgi:hypothetical protein
MRRRRAEAGQATIEFVAVIPLLAVVALAAGQWLAAGSARELARHAAEAGAVALFEGTGAADAARQAVPGADRGRLRVTVRGRRVTVTVRPETVVPGIGDLLDATAVAVAGGRA